MEQFTYFTGTRVDFGVGAVKQIAAKLKELGMMKPCLVSDQILLGQPFAKEIVSSLVNAVVYSGVVPNPTIRAVNDCAKFCRDNGCDGLVALGGGSAMDTVKGAAVAAVTGKSVEWYLDGKGANREPLPPKTLPFVAIPTTAGTGSEVSQYAVITDETTKRKDSISSFAMYPLYAVVDPELTYGLPKSITVATGLDVLGHALEAITSTIHNPLTDILALEAINKVFTYLPEAANENTAASRCEMALASTLAGIAMSHCCGSLPHGMGCPLSGHCGVPHGLAVGVLQIPTLKLIAATSRTQLERVSRFLSPSFLPDSDISAAEYLIQRIGELFQAVGREPNLREFHITAEQISAMVPDAMAHGCTGLMPVLIKDDTVRELYEQLA